MKTIGFITALLISMLTMSVASAQNYKKQFPSIDASGKITDEKGKHLGWVTHDGMIKDAAGAKMAHVDATGNAVDAKSGKNLGKAAKNGNFVYHVENSGADSLAVSPPMNGTCEVKDTSGKTVLVVHESYKQYGACAYHCLSMKKDHKEMKMKQ